MTTSQLLHWAIAGAEGDFEGACAMLRKRGTAEALSALRVIARRVDIFRRKTGQLPTRLEIVGCGYVQAFTDTVAWGSWVAA